MIHPIRPSLPPPDLDAACEPLLVLRMHLTLARDIAQRMSLGDVPNAVKAEMVEAWDGINSVIHDNTDPALAIMQQAADEAAGEQEAAHIASERGVHRHASVSFGRGR